MVKRLLQYFCFPDRSIKAGEILDFQKEGNLRKGGGGGGIEKVKNTIPWTHIINDLNGKEIIGRFYEKELQKTNQK